MKTKTLILHCQICPNEVGNVQLFIEAPDITEDQYREKTGIVDQRCDQCDTDHGTFRELSERFEKEAKGTPAEAEMFVVKHRKRADFEVELLKEKEKREKEVKNDDIITP